jgi:hypothetical protein
MMTDRNHAHEMQLAEEAHQIVVEMQAHYKAGTLVDEDRNRYLARLRSVMEEIARIRPGLDAAARRYDRSACFRNGGFGDSGPQL